MSKKLPKSRPQTASSTSGSTKIAPAGKNQIVLDTPQQDSDWSEAKKFEWLKTSSAKLIKVFNQA